MLIISFYVKACLTKNLFHKEQQLIEFDKTIIEKLLATRVRPERNRNDD